MGTVRGTIGVTGSLRAKKIKAPKPPLAWQLKQFFRKDRIQGLLGLGVARIANKFGVLTITSTLRAVHIDGQTGAMTNYGVVSRRLVTTAFVVFMVDNLQAETTEWGDFKYHDSGVGVTGAAIGDTDIETTDGEARATGSQEEGASTNIYKSIGTITYTTTKAITEHGLFSKATGTTLLDRHTFTAINVVATDSIQFTYELTCSAGG